MEWHLLAMAAGFALDLALGDPENAPHPVRAIGRLIGALEIPLRRRAGESPGKLFAGGVILAFAAPALTGAAAFLLLSAAGLLGAPVRAAAEAILIYYLLAARSLGDAGLGVFHALETDGPDRARELVSRIVGRDTERLDGAGIARAAVETVAENTSDGVIAPLFYLALGGPVLGWIYKAINTLDSMVGYQNERYLWFGRASARLDDAVNFLPWRLAGLLMIAVSFPPDFDRRRAAAVWRRERRKHKSPNSAQTEAACAGALGVRLAGDAWYFGKRVSKPYIGDDVRPVRAGDIRLAVRLMYGASLCGMALALLVRGLILAA